jgi:ketosteroid isomerase-like protein
VSREGDKRDATAPVAEFPADVVAEDFEFTPAVTGVVEAATYRGRSGWERYREDAAAAWSALSLELDELTPRGERVLALGRLRGVGRGSGGEVDQSLAFVSTIGEGRITRIEGFRSRAEAMEALESD